MLNWPLPTMYMYLIPLAVETPAVFTSEVQVFFCELNWLLNQGQGRRDIRPPMSFTEYFVAVQWGNTGVVMGTSS